MSNNTNTDYKALKAAVDEYLAQLGVKVEIRLIGDACPMFCTDKGKPGIGTFPRKTHIHGQQYQMALTRGDKSLTVDYWNSYHDAELRATGMHQYYISRGERRATLAEMKDARTVHAADVLGAVELYNVGTFEDFCAEFGYDVDSRKAESVYKAVQVQYADFKRMFTGKELEMLAEKVRKL